ncbi:unnamed protein product [Lepeophtheirus salmonis]|uniref:(salmon louse) hypothetical protein n=1 Tax=Lepeophtheirus salmonis TaxID=72036 RepID=A0A817FG69_LEPSM|nr:unnamed protein product [Lepeophtheirus salmonis]
MVSISAGNHGYMEYCTKHPNPSSRPISSEPEYHQRRKDLIIKKDLTVFVPFATIYLCKTGVSRLLHIKTKSRKQLDPQHDMQVALSTKIPRFDTIVNRKQQQQSH